VAYRQRETQSGPELRAATLGRAAWQTCAQRGELGYFPKRPLDPNPLYWSPSRHAAQTVLGSADGGNGLHQKVTRLRFRFLKEHSLAWVCSSKGARDRNIEIEAAVYPQYSRRWSDNWESHSDAQKTTLRGFPEPIYQDDISSGDGYLNPGDKQDFPDFAIVTGRPRAMQYRRLLSIDFVTNEGKIDAGSVIYSTQATSWAKDGGAIPSAEESYCIHPFGGRKRYVGCTFGRVTACSSYNNQNAIVPLGARYYAKVDWASVLDNAFTLRGVSNNRASIDQQRKFVQFYCNPRPPSNP
jgi:hypothetical protein